MAKDFYNAKVAREMTDYTVVDARPYSVLNSMMEYIHDSVMVGKSTAIYYPLNDDFRAAFNVEVLDAIDDLKSLGYKVTDEGEWAVGDDGDEDWYIFKVTIEW